MPSPGLEWPWREIELFFGKGIRVILRACVQCDYVGGVGRGVCGGKRPSLLFVCSEVFLPFVHASSSSQEEVDV